MAAASTECFCEQLFERASFSRGEGMKHNWEKRADRQTEGKIVRLKGREKQWKTLLREIESKQQKERQFHYQRHPVYLNFPTELTREYLNRRIGSI